MAVVVVEGGELARSGLVVALRIQFSCLLHANLGVSANIRMTIRTLPCKDIRQVM